MNFIGKAGLVAKGITLDDTQANLRPWSYFFVGAAGPIFPDRDRHAAP
jgi:hypothetical protein